MKKIMLTSLVAMFATMAANAGMYITGSVRTQTNEEEVVAGVDTDKKEEAFDNLFLDVAVGYKFDGAFRMETDVLTSQFYNVDESVFTLTVLPMNLKGIYDFDMSSKFMPYVGVGVNNLYFVDTDAIDGSAGMDVFGIVGVTYELDSNFMIDLQYNRTLAYDSNGDAVDASYDGVNQFKLGVRYNF